MSRFYKILALPLGMLLLLSFPGNPPDGYSGAPNDGICSNCHIQNNPPQDGMITVTGFPTTITPNTAYPLTLTSSNPNGLAELAGFQITILNGSNNQAGTITGASAGSTVSTSGGRQYWEHNPAQPYPMSNMVSWTATWTSPTMPPNTTITYYAAGNIANGNNQSSGDRIVTAQGSGMLQGGSSNLAVTISNFNNIDCNGDNTGSATATASLGNPPYSYSWSNGASTATISNLFVGTYTVTVTDEDESTATASITLTEPPVLDLNAPFINHVTCNGGNNGSISSSVSGGQGPYSYQWTNGGSTATINNLTAGTYGLTVTDDNGCTINETYTVNQPAGMTINLLNLEHETCAGENDGSIQISVTGGVQPVFANWSHGAIGLSLSDLAPDTYTVTVTDNNDCTKTASYTINDGSLIDVNLVQIQHVSCFNGNNGSITVNATGGNTPYAYEWSNGAFGASISNLTAANYLVTVTDENGCEVVEAYTINQPPVITLSINQSSPNVCFGDTTADLTATVGGGVPPYNTIWSNGETSLNNTNLAAGTYTITVTDANGCTSTQSSVVSQPAQLTLNVTTTDETSLGANNGTATANAGGGSPGYTYLWSNGATTQIITNLAPGTYSVTITDTNGCTATASGQVNVFGCSIDINLPNDFLMCEDDTAQISSTVIGGTGGLTFLWSTGQTTPTIMVNTGGEYCVSVTDESNCQASECILVTEDIIPPLTCPVINESAPGANDGLIDCSSGVFASYSWSNGATTSAISNLSPGEYCVTVVNINGCSREQCFNVQAAGCQLSVTATQTDVACAGDSTGSITLSVTGGTEPVTYAWSNGATTATNTGLTAGEYAVTITDALGCVDSRSFVILEADPIIIMVDSIAPVTDFPSGAIHITVAGGIPPYTFVWTDPSGSLLTGEDLTGLGEFGFYKIEVVDASNCSVSLDSIFVEQADAVNNPSKFKDVRIYPNPAQDKLFVQIEGAIQEALISGIDGRMYKRIEKPLHNELNVHELHAGWYILRISDGTNWYIARFVK